MVDPSARSKGLAAGPCPTDDELAGFVEGRDLSGQRRRIDAHVAACSRCAAALAAYARGLDGSASVPTPDADTRAATDPATVTAAGARLRRGEVVGRYLLLDRIGQGGMGVVYAAYDPELDRRVAIKVLLGSRDHGPEARARLLREAQALARLSHPHVVGVHDVGTTGGEVWLAMEFVAGRTLSRWLSARRRGWREVLAVLLRAGEGVAAVHAAGLVHRDLKPDNVMIGDDGRVRVMDFGLARTDRSLDMALEAGPDGARVDALTRTGALVGTPAYMAPEQLQGRDADARSDQFSLCATAWEALFGERAFAGTTLPELITNIQGGVRRPPPQRSQVPRWLRAALERGLSLDPSSRWPSLAALLATLQRGQARARWVRVGAALAVLVAVVAGAAGWRQWQTARRVSACEAEGAGIAELWNDRARGSLRAGLLASGAPDAVETAERVMPWLERQAEAWRSARTETCMDNTVRGLWSDDLRDRSLWCLDDRRDNLGALIEELSRADRTAASLAVQGAANLQRVDRCRDPHLLGRLSAPPQGEALSELREIRRALARASSLDAAGRFALALAAAHAAVERARTLEWPPLTAAAHHRLGMSLHREGDFSGAERELEDAYFLAVGSGALEVAADAAIQLVFEVGAKLRRRDEALRWGRLAQVELDRLTDDALDPRAGVLRNNLAAIHLAFGAPADALPLFEQAAAIYEAAFGDEHPNLAKVLQNLAMVHYQLGRYDEARELSARTLVITEAALGPNHPQTAIALVGAAGVDLALGALDRARARLERAMDVQEAASGPEHPDVARIAQNLATVYKEMGDHAAALPLFERALAIYEKTTGAETPEVAMTLNNLAGVHVELGDLATARRHFERALALWEKILGPEHPDVALALFNLGVVDARQGSRAAARDHLSRALAVWEAALGPGHPDVAEPLVELARLDLDEERPLEALARAERAVSILERGEARPRELALARFTLARSLWAAGGDRRRAAELAVRSAGALRDDPGAARDLRAVESWLEGHSEPHRP